MIMISISCDLRKPLNWGYLEKFYKSEFQNMNIPWTNNTKFMIMRYGNWQFHENYFKPTMFTSESSKKFSKEKWATEDLESNYWLIMTFDKVI